MLVPPQRVYALSVPCAIIDNKTSAIIDNEINPHAEVQAAHLSNSEHSAGICPIQGCSSQQGHSRLGC